MCDSCKRVSAGTIFCEEHAPNAAAAAQGAPYSQPAYPHAVADPSASPGLALFLGFIPGVGAIYNGQYAKGLIHAIIFGMLVSIVGSNYVGALEPLFGILIAVWVFYMVLEAYHTARKRRAGEPIDEFSSLVDLRGAGSTRFPAGAVLLILLGGVLLLSTTEVISMERLMRYWPVLLIVAGAYMLYTRMSAARAADRTEASHGEQ
jgi:TM2 domain-containing membrane protein YozV